MKPNKYKSKKVVKELAEQLDIELNSTLPIKVLPNGMLSYKDYIIKKQDNQNWAVYNRHSKDLIDQFFLKSCALLAAKAYSQIQVEKFFEIKRLDNKYWANHANSLIYKHNIKQTKDYERYLILLTKLEESQTQTVALKDEISRMFRWSFV